MCIKILEVTIGENLPCQRELNNKHNPFAVSVPRNETNVGHAPRTVSYLQWNLKNPVTYGPGLLGRNNEVAGVQC